MSIVANTTNTADIHVRIDAKTKKEAEDILARLGISPSGAISMFYKQISMQGEIPFKVSLKNLPTPAYEDMDKEQILSELAKGEEGYHAGRLHSLEEVAAKMR